MNKLMGFFELKDSGLPTIPWLIYDDNTSLDFDKLWTIRTAVDRGDDLNLPRQVGVDAITANSFAKQMAQELKNKGIVIYYPYFIAEKSGVIEINKDIIIIEAVKGDLWNYVNNHLLDVSLLFMNNEWQIKKGDAKFILDNEKELLLSNAIKARYRFRSDISDGKSIFLEWSFAYASNKDKQPIGTKELVFYEARAV